MDRSHYSRIIHNNLAQLINVISILSRVPDEEKIKYFKELDAVYSMLPEIKRAVIALVNMEPK